MLEWERERVERHRPAAGWVVRWFGLGFSAPLWAAAPPAGEPAPRHTHIHKFGLWKGILGNVVDISCLNKGWKMLTCASELWEESMVSGLRVSVVRVSSSTSSSWTTFSIYMLSEQQQNNKHSLCMQTLCCPLCIHNNIIIFCLLHLWIFYTATEKLYGNCSLSRWAGRISGSS